MKVKKLFISLIIISILIVWSGNLMGQVNFKILSYNILMGFQSDSTNKKDYISWVKELDPDIVAYQEMNTFTQKSFEEFALKYNHPYAVISKTEGFPVGLSSKYPIVDVQKVVDNMHHAYLYANINGINIIVIHFSPFSYQKRQLEVREVLARAALIPKNEKVMIMGDFNSLSQTDSGAYTEEAIQVMREREKTDSRARNLNNGNIDYSVTGAMVKAGFIDIHNRFHSDFQKSVQTKKYETKYPKRIDYMWLNQGIAKYVKSADFIYDDVTNRISDHYPLFVTFMLK